MAVKLKVPVIPIHLRGMFEIYSIHHSWPETGPVRMRIGPPIHFEEGQAYGEVAAQIEKAVNSLAM